MLVNVKVKFWIYQWHLPIVVFLVLLAPLVPIMFKSWASDWKVIVPVMGGLFSFAYAVQKLALEENRLFRELFDAFNNRYDQLDSALNAIRDGDGATPLTPSEKSTLYRYFNLCGEEYLYYRKGYIDPEAWKSWFNGMIIYHQNSRIKRLWQEELQSNSYYGLTLPDGEPHQNQSATKRRDWERSI
jgi:hypothetical protein